MSRIRTAVAAATICCAVMLAGAATASAQDSVPFTKTMAIAGTNKGEGPQGHPPQRAACAWPPAGSRS